MYLCDRWVPLELIATIIRDNSWAYCCFRQSCEAGRKLVDKVLMPLRAKSHFTQCRVRSNDGEMQLTQILPNGTENGVGLCLSWHSPYPATIRKTVAMTPAQYLATVTLPKPYSVTTSYIFMDHPLNETYRWDITDDGLERGYRRWIDKFKETPRHVTFYGCVAADRRYSMELSLGISTFKHHVLNPHYGGLFEITESSVNGYYYLHVGNMCNDLIVYEKERYQQSQFFNFIYNEWWLMGILILKYECVLLDL